MRAAIHFLCALSLGLVSLIAARGTAATTAAEFAAECAQTGVLKCVSFDTDSDFNDGNGGTQGAWGDRFGIMPPSGTSNYTRATRDTSVKVSGAGSLKFTIPATAGSDTSGAWFTNFTDDLSFQVGEGDEVYVQWRERISSNILSTTYTQANGSTPSDGIKLADISAGDLMTCSLGTANSTLCPTSCWDFEVVVQNVGQNEQPVMYANCAGSFAYNGMYGMTSNITVQNGVGCLYPTYAKPPCIPLVGDEWMTFQVHVRVGHWDQWDSTIQLWVAREGQASVLVIDCSPTAADKCQGGGPDRDGWNLHNSNPTYKIGKVWLLPYHTNRSASFTYADSFVWYDNLIISKNKIADPTPGVGPNPPTSLSAQ